MCTDPGLGRAHQAAGRVSSACSSPHEVMILRRGWGPAGWQDRAGRLFALPEASPGRGSPARLLSPLTSSCTPVAVCTVGRAGHCPWTRLRKDPPSGRAGHAAALPHLCPAGTLTGRKRPCKQARLAAGTHGGGWGSRRAASEKQHLWLGHTFVPSTGAGLTRSKNQGAPVD